MQSIEEFVEQYWNVIDNHSLSNALQITSQRHKENIELLELIRNNLVSPDSLTSKIETDKIMMEMYKEITARCQYEKRWRNFLTLSVS